MMTVFIILLLIVLNGLFVAAEFALLGAPRAALEQMGVSGNMVARRVSQILKTPRLQDRYIATAQLGVTFASLGLGMYGEHAVAGWLHEWLAQYGWASWLVAHGAASILSVAVLTYLHIVLGEWCPRRFPYSTPQSFAHHCDAHVRDPAMSVSAGSGYECPGQFLSGVAGCGP